MKKKNLPEDSCDEITGLTGTKRWVFDSETVWGESSLMSGSQFQHSSFL